MCMVTHVGDIGLCLKTILSIRAFRTRLLPRKTRLFIERIRGSDGNKSTMEHNQLKRGREKRNFDKGKGEK